MEQISNCFKSLIGISFFSMLADMLMMDGKFKKYVKSIIGVVVLSVIFKGFSEAAPIRWDSILAEEQQVLQHNNTWLMEDVELRVAEKIKLLLEKNGIAVESVQVTLNERLSAERITVQLVRDFDAKRANQILKEECGTDEIFVE